MSVSQIGIQAEDVTTADAGQIEGELTVPEGSKGIVLFVHGSGSSRHSPRNRFVAEQLQSRGLATLLFDLLTAEEDEADRLTGHLRFDIGLLTQRLSAAADWVRRNEQTAKLRVGYFGASTGSAAALRHAAQSDSGVQAIVSRGGRPDLAEDALGGVRAPTLLIVGQEDAPVVEMNRSAQAEMRCETKLEIVPKASHLFEEPGTLEEVSRLAGNWFDRHLAGV